MAELLIVVAIIIVLAGVSFIAVQNHQRSLAQLERNTIAKEIFFAAQNHLAMAESQGYLEATDFGTESTADGDAGKNIYYIVNSGTPTAGTMLDLMLPFGSIDETVRSGGSYLIRYQSDPAIVLDVFYATPNCTPQRFARTITDGDYNEMLGYKANGMPSSGGVVGYYGGPEAALIGDYDAIQAPEIIVENGDRLIVKVKDTTGSDVTAPDGDGTLVKVDTYLELIITGEAATTGTGEAMTSKTAKAVILLKKPAGSSSDTDQRVTGPDDEGYYTVVLDDITSSDMHFVNLNEAVSNTAEDATIWFMADPNDATGTTKTPFRPGEDITVQAVAFSNSTFTNIAYSSARTTNSLFADDVSETGIAEPLNVNVGSFRHLENLDPRVSDLSQDFMPADSTEVLTATQIEDLDWAAFRSNIADVSDAYANADGVMVCYTGKDPTTNASTAAKTVAGGYLPVNPTYALEYNGGIKAGKAANGDEPATNAKYHSITGVKVGTAEEAYNGDAGLFGSPTGVLTVNNLELIDFDITGSGDAGALAGNLGNGSNVTNVLAHNSSAFEAEKNKAATIISTDAGGSAGGLIGSMNGTTVEKCAAALVVSGKANAGGLVGVVGDTNKSTVQACYAAGHTVDKKNGTNVIGVWYGDVSDDDNTYNITAIGSAGGLIGSLAAGSEVKNCYSTCSVSSTDSGENALAGGFVGNGSSGTSGTIENCYATGLVHGATAGAFAGKLTANPKDCKYFEIVNEIVDETTGMISYLPPVPGSETTTGIAALDESAKTYNDFTGADGTWTDAEAYDATLAQYYTVGDGLKYNLKSIPRLAGDAYTASGEGMPADFVATHYGDWPAPEIFVINEKSGS